MSMAKSIKIEEKWQMHVIMKIHFFPLLKKMNMCIWKTYISHYRITTVNDHLFCFTSVFVTLCLNFKFPAFFPGQSLASIWLQPIDGSVTPVHVSFVSTASLTSQERLQSWGPGTQRRKVASDLHSLSTLAWSLLQSITR